jgi:hypothetical protein
MTMLRVVGIAPTCGTITKSTTRRPRASHRRRASSNGDLAFSSTEAKFRSDFDGAARHEAGGFVFITNQAPTLKERDDLANYGRAQGRIVEIIHRERIRILLDSPRGYGLRLTYLQIPMTSESSSRTSRAPIVQWRRAADQGDPAPLARLIEAMI